MRVVICGGGVIGASIAYFLGCRGVQSIVIERTGVACPASGKSGGVSAPHWGDGPPLAALARRSFALHARLPAEIGDDYGYRRLATFGGLAEHRIAGGPRRTQFDFEWLSDNVTLNHRLGSAETTAQVHPGQFTAAM